MLYMYHSKTNSLWKCYINSINSFSVSIHWHVELDMSLWAGLVHFIFTAEDNIHVYKIKHKPMYTVIEHGEWHW